MNIIYLASAYAKLNTTHTVIYQDKFVRRDLDGDMLHVDLKNFDLILATPPCNYYSKANYRRNTSSYSLDTKHLLPDIINKLKKINKPFIVENVRNDNLMKDIINNFNGYIYYHGRHIYFSNIFFTPYCVPQIKDNINFKNTKQRQGGKNVNTVFELFIDYVNDLKVLDL
jgi:site-specific DNA-cytosine methylase